jgi:hypothetical protein
VFAATLSPSNRRLWIEDVVVWKGRALLTEETFQARWRLATQWVEHYCIQDPRLLGGVEVELAEWGALESVAPEGSWDFVCADAVGARRLWWFARHSVAAPIASAAPRDPSAPLVAIATREPGPDRWALSSADGVALGHALVRTLKVSSALRTQKTNTARVDVVWTSSFSKWEIVGLTGDVASHSSFFEAAK